jgi:hypothetical protein
MPKKGTPEEVALRAFMTSYDFPDVSRFDIAKIEEVLEKLKTDCHRFLNELFPPKPDYTNQCLTQINHEFHTLALLTKTRDPVEIALLVTKLRFSKAIVSPQPTNRSFLKRARRFLGQKAIRVQNSARFRREKSLAQRKEKSIKHLFDTGDVKKAWERVKQGADAGKCPIPGEVLYEAHTVINQGSKSATPPLVYDIDPITSIPEIASTRPRPCTTLEDDGEMFTEAEIKNAFKRANKNSAAGPDKLTLRLFLLGGDNVVAFIAVLYERLRVLRVVPRNWKVGEMQLGYKKGDKMSVSNWRPITLLCALYKLFTACLDRRLHAHDKLLKAQAPGASLFSSNQRGFRPRISGCTDNAALLRRLEAVAQRKGGKLFQLYIDFKNAFGSPDHELIFLILDWFNIPRYLADLVRSAYDGSTIKIRFGDNKLSPAFNVEKGTFQGDPISPALFALCVELLIRLLNTLEEVPVSPMAISDTDVGTNNEAYADDMVTLALTLFGLTLMSSALFLFCKVTDIDCNATKTMSTATVYKSCTSSNRTSINPQLAFGPRDGVIFPGLEKTETYTYLGAEAAGSGKSRITTARLRTTLQERGALLNTAITVPYVKSGLHHMFVSPKINYSLSYWTIRPSQCETLNKVVRKSAKSFEQLRPSICDAAVYAPLYLGGLGFTDINNAALTSYTPPYLRRLFLADKVVRFAEIYALFHECHRLAMTHPSTDMDGEDIRPDHLLHSPALFVKFMDKHTPPDLATALRGLSLVPGLAFHGSTYNVYSLGINFLNEPVETKPNVFHHHSLPTKVQLIIDMLKQEVRKLERKAWALMPLHGATMRALDGHELAPRACQSPHMTHPRLFTVQERRFAILCQTNQINCGTNLFQWNLASTPNCPCCGMLDTVLHTLNWCLPRLHHATERHDSIHDVLTKRLALKYPRDQGFKQRSDISPDSRYSSSQLRPDETIYIDSRTKSDGSKSSNFAMIIDVKSPFPQTDFIATKDIANKSWYEDIRRGYENKLGRATVSTLIIPSTGPIPMHSYTVLKDAGLDGRSLCKILREMSVAATKANFAYSKTLPLPSRSTN